jgi:hypothetical protein
LEELKKQNSKPKRKRIFSGATKFGKLNSNKQMSLPAPVRESVANIISTREHTGPIAFPSLPVSILKKGAGNSSDKKHSRRFGEIPMQVPRKESKDTTAKDLIKNQRLVL